MPYSASAAAPAELRPRGAHAVDLLERQAPLRLPGDAARHAGEEPAGALRKVSETASFDGWSEHGEARYRIGLEEAADLMGGDAAAIGSGSSRDSTPASDATKPMGRRAQPEGELGQEEGRRRR